MILYQRTDMILIDPYFQNQLVELYKRYLLKFLTIKSTSPKFFRYKLSEVFGILRLDIVILFIPRNHFEPNVKIIPILRKFGVVFASYYGM